jgi:DNA-directed RNA polymerase subunit N (RpoN/RPB10)
MLIPIRCPSCGYPIGEYADLFRESRIRRVREVLAARGTTATQACVDPGLQIDCADILDALHVLKYCCRAHLATAMEFIDYY